MRVIAAIGSLIFCFPAGALPNCEHLATLATKSMTITAAELVNSTVFDPPNGKSLTALPPFCRVAATLHPSDDSAIGIELWMPVNNWNGRLEGTGNGGFGGHFAYESLAAALKRGYAVVNTDMGMATPHGQDAAIFIARPERWKDWGFRSTHEMTVQAKRMIIAFYGRPPSHDYFIGCSTGGEQALMEAQRFPDDYEGIVAGAPAHHRTGVHESILWNFASTQQTPQSQISAPKLRSLAKAVMAACDRLDGLPDGIISDPEKCSFDPSSVQCSGPDSDDCLSAGQVAAARRLYAGPINPRTGLQIYPGLPKGSELGWSQWVQDAKGQAPFAPLFEWVFGADWNWRTFDFDQDLTAVDNKLAADLNATSADLDAFAAHGHKILVYHGWADALVSPAESIHYRSALLTRYSPRSLNGFYRLFMVPGMTHCNGGVGPDKFDAIGAVVNWVENGRAPETIVASQPSPHTNLDRPVRTRPLCPYPDTANYKGSGSPDEQANFSCSDPAR